MDEGGPFPPGLRLRRVAPGDVDVVLRHRRRMFEDMGLVDDAALGAMVASGREALGRWIEDGVYHGWLVESGDEVLAGGGVFLTPWPPSVTDGQPRRATILNVYTERPWRRQGLARRLMLVMIGWCEREGFRAVFLDASADGRALYEALGFRPTTQMRLELSTLAPLR